MSKMTCNGPRLFVKDKLAALERHIVEVGEKVAATSAEGLPSLQRKLDELQAELKTFRGRTENDYLGRAGCGADLTAQIEALPADGEVYWYRCPTCGNVGTVRKAVPVDIDVA